MARFDGGWVKVYRELLDTDIAKNPTRLSLFINLISMANVEDSWVDWAGRPRVCPRGSLVTSFRELADRIGADKGSVERQLKYLSLRDTLSMETEPRGTFITINNYSDYQDTSSASRTVKGHRQDADAYTGADTDTDSNEETKKLRNKETKNIYTCAFDFHSIYSKYPIQQKGPFAEKRFAEQIRTQQDFDDIQKALTNYLQYLKNEPWRKPKQNFSTFLGTEKSGFFWREWINFNPDSTKPKSGVDEWAAEQMRKESSL